MKLWKLKNKLFGWDYVYWESWDDYCRYKGVARVHIDAEGKPYHWGQSGILLPINKSEDVTWLTCSPSKYFPVKLYDFSTQSK